MEELDDVRVLRHFDDADTFGRRLELNRDLVSIFEQRAEQRVTPANPHPFIHTALHGRHVPLKHGCNLWVIGLSDGLKAIRALPDRSVNGLDVVKQRMNGVHVNHMVFVAHMAHAAAHHALTTTLTGTSPHAHPRPVFRLLNKSHLSYLAYGVTTTSEEMDHHPDSGGFDDLIH